MEKKQSSVEWFITEFQKQIEFVPNSELDLWFKNLFPKAKAMHKEEIQTSHECGQQSEKDYNRNGDKIGCRFIEKSEQYYNETFGGNNE